MKSGSKLIVAIARTKWFKGAAAVAAVVAVAGAVIGQSALPPLVQLAAEPLYARGVRAKPTLTLALSVEFPTVGAQYVGNSSTLDDTYAPTNEYVGYFDTSSCYAYVDVPTEARPGGVPEADYKRFDRLPGTSGDANRAADGSSLRTCGGRGFSGNFMNWAGSSAIDILRLGLSGGDRVVDTAVVTANGTTGLTVLQRAVLPTGFYNSSNFPTKKLLAAQAADAVPTPMLRTTAGTAHAGDVYIANCLDRIYVGTAATGGCGNAGQNGDLGVKVGAIPANGAYTGPLPIGSGSGQFVQVAGENANFTVAAGATQQIAYGANNAWSVQTLTAGTYGCTNGRFGDPIPGTLKACYARDPVSSAAVSGVTADGFLYARVRVCESTAAGLSDPRTSLCLQYPNGAFKPVGNLQKYSDRLRVAAFGYLNDSTGNPNERYGGVLRAPMKYVGPKKFDANFALESAANAAIEWDVSTGQLVANPDQAAEGRSGVINYLNQFGRTGASPGVYKTYDPVGELYYESLRYLQGLPPTPAATSGLTTAMKDGFPVYTTWTDPHPPVVGMNDYSCVRNNIVAIGDVNTHNDKQIPGNTRTSGGNDGARAADAAANEPNFVDWTKVVGAFESNTAITYVDGQGATRTVSNPNPPNTARWGMENQNIGADQAAYYMAGMAYWANTHDIRGTGWTTNSNDANGVTKQRPGMRVTTYVLDVNEFAQQTSPAAHKNNAFFLASKYGGFRDSTGTGNPFIVPAANGGTTPIASNEGWEEPPTGSGEAKNYFLSSSAKAVLKALDDIFESIAKQSNSIAGSAVSTQSLTTSDGFIYQAQFDPTDWSGDVAAISVSSSASGGAVSVGGAASPPWTSAAAVLATKAPSTRQIFVGPRNASAGAAAFTWASLDATYKAALKTPLGGTTPTDSDAVGQQRLDYLRGDRTLESAPGTFRRRGRVLGDIVNSGIAYSGALSERYKASSFGTFYDDNAGRKKALFVGANDGMLHAFDAATGDELFAYIPSWVVPKLSALTSPNYVHQSYVDSPPAVAEAKVGADWKTVLVSGSGGGGQGVFALDVTNPNTIASTGASAPFDAGKVLWEFTDRDDGDLGNVTGTPLILPFRTAAGTTKHFAVVASGVNNHAPDGNASTTGASALFLLDLAKPAGAAWALGSNYFKIVFPNPDTSIAAGMLNLTARVDAAGTAAQIYAGDLQGNLWKLDFTRATAGTADWTLAKLSPFVSAGVPVPFYIARDGGVASVLSRQPISMAPTLVFGPGSSIVIAFGTGKFLEVADISGSYKPQSVYAVLDNGSTALDVADSAVAGRGRLQQGTVSGNAVAVPAYTWGRPATDNAATGVRAGWYFDFPSSTATGERQVSNFELLGSRAVFGSVIPSVTSCDNGSGNLYVVDLLTGGGTTRPSTVGIFGEPLVLPVEDTSLTLGLSDSTGRRIQKIRRQVIIQGAGGVAAPPDLSQVDSLFVGRLSWRELSNYPSLR